MTKQIKPVVISYDITDLCHLSAQDRKYIKRINDVFLYDEQRHTHVCEFTPSYFLVNLYNAIHFVEGTPDDVVDRLENVYGQLATEDTYMHVRDADRHVRKTKLDPVDYDPDVDEEDDDSYESKFEEIREYCCGNWQLD